MMCSHSTVVSIAPRCNVTDSPGSNQGLFSAKDFLMHKAAQLILVTKKVKIKVKRRII